jgi:hypothetical protein
MYTNKIVQNKQKIFEIKFTLFLIRKAAKPAVAVALAVSEYGFV